MSDFPIVSPDTLDISKITATEPKKKNDRLQSYLMYDGAQFYIETEWGRAPFGVRSFVGGEKTDYTLNISLTPDGDFVKKLVALDEFMIDFGIEHSMTIFKKKYTPSQKEVVRAMYTSSVKVADEGDYPPRIAPKIQKKSVSDPTPRLLFYHSETEEVEIENFDQLVKLVPPSSRVKAIIQLKPWFVSGRFGITYTVEQLLVSKRAGGRPLTYAFNDRTGAIATKIPAAKATEGIEDDEEGHAAENDADEQENTDVVSVENSDNVAEVEEEEDEEEAPPPKNVKKAPGPVAAAPKKAPVAAPKRK